MTFPRYPDYQDSSVEWLGEMPAHWGTSALKRVASLRSGETINSDSIDEAGEYPVYGGNGLRGYTDAFTHEGFFSLIGRQGALCGNVNYAYGKFWASEHAVVVSLVQKADPKWLGELLRSMNLNQYSVSAAQPGLSVEIISNLVIPVPPLTEQTTIAAFLDRETAKIDALVAEQEQLIALLVEKRQAVISHAVTKGIDPTAPMKNSGIEWLGEVPEHWDVLNLGNISQQIQTGPFGSQLHAEDYVEGQIPVINPSNIQDGKVIPNWENTVTPTIVERLCEHKLQQGDIVFARRGEMGRCALVTKYEVGWLCGTGSMNVRLHNRAVPEFVSLTLQTQFVREWLRLESVGSTMDNLNGSILSRVPFVLPPIQEQSSVVCFLNKQTSKIDELIIEAEHAIDLLKEHRSALISAAVTGKIDVRGLVDGEAA